MLYSKVVEIDERVIPEWPEFIKPDKTVADNGQALILTDAGVVMRQIQSISELFKPSRDADYVADETEVRQQLESVYAQGYRSLAIVFAHSYLFPTHEQHVAAIAREIGFTSISASSDIEPKIGFIARGQSATADAYLTPEVQRYLKGFAKGFKGRLTDGSCRVSFMQSDGALADFGKFSGLRAILCELIPRYGFILRLIRIMHSGSGRGSRRVRSHILRQSGQISSRRL